VDVEIKLVGCPDWGAKPPKRGLDSIVWTPGESVRIIFHHTAGHHAEIALPGDESPAEAIRYARDIQAFHQDVRGWNDSGHNFLVCRNGMILQGRWRTIRAIQHRKMVVSAHCPGQNDQIGIEHEHQAHESMTAAQREASARLQAWIAGQYGKRHVLPVDPHSAHYATDCPANLVKDIEALRARGQAILQGV
jgi:N-acetylmuramoyl-L-alanine amidase